MPLPDPIEIHKFTIAKRKMMIDILKKFGLTAPYQGVSTGQLSWLGAGEKNQITSPVDGKGIGEVNSASGQDFEKVVQEAQAAFEGWRLKPAPLRGEIVRQFGEELRKHKEDLGALVSYEMGKSLQEGWGEVQEMIDICDFAVGLSRQLYWFANALRTSRPSNDGTMAPSWCRGHYFCFQFPSCSMGVERCHCLDLWKCMRMETI